MQCGYGVMEERWYREGNAARTVAGLSRTYVFPMLDGTTIVLVAAELGADEREAEFERLLLQYWCRQYGLPEARERMREFVHGADSVAD